MAQDFAKRKTKRKTQPAPRFSLGSFVLGVITGVSLFLLGAYGPELLMRADSAPVLATTEPGDSSPQTAESEDPAEAPGPDNTLEFVFRDLLGEDEVAPDIAAYEVDAAAQLANEPMQYLLQSGSFQIKADAEMRRGALLLLNLPANVVEAHIDNRIWYRVIVGPYDQRGAAQQALSRLKANDIQSIWMERPMDAG